MGTPSCHNMFLEHICILCRWVQKMYWDSSPFTCGDKPEYLSKHPDAAPHYIRDQCKNHIHVFLTFRCKTREKEKSFQVCGVDKELLVKHLIMKIRFQLRLGQIPKFSICYTFDSYPTRFNSVRFLTLILISSTLDRLNFDMKLSRGNKILQLHGIGKF